MDSRVLNNNFCSNPDQSKHLETARMRICDVWVDFVNLRCEEYSDNSRIPTKVYIIYLSESLHFLITNVPLYRGRNFFFG